MLEIPGILRQMMLEIPGIEARGMQQGRAAGEFFALLVYSWPWNPCRNCQTEPENPKLPQKGLRTQGRGWWGEVGLLKCELMPVLVPFIPFQGLYSQQVSRHLFLPGFTPQPPAVGTAGIPWMSQNAAQPCWHPGIS